MNDEHPFRTRIVDALRLLHTPEETEDLLASTCAAAGLHSGVRSADDMATWARALKERGGVYQAFAASLLAQAAIHGAEI